MGDRPVRPTRSAPRSRAGIVVCAAAALAGAVWITWSLGAAGKEAPPPDFPETHADTPPPAAQEPRTEKERVERLIRDFLFAGDNDDAEWARGVLARGGEYARAEVAEAARRCVRSNRAFVEHALDLLLRDPRPDDLPLAGEALDSPDTQVTRRALLLFGKVGGPGAHESIRKIADVAKDSWPAPAWALETLVALGGEDAVAEVERIATSPEFLSGAQEQALASLGLLGGERARTVLLREFAAAVTDERILAAAQGLVAMGDPTPLPKLREMLAKNGDDRALNLLARAHDDAAFKELERRLRAPLESEARQVQALAILAYFPFDQRASLLRFAAAAGRPRDVRVAAWDQLLADGGPAEAAAACAMLRAEGAAAKEDRYVAALAASRLHDPATVQALLAAEKANRDDHELRAILLRSLALTGAPEAAETVVRAIASDPTEHAGPDSMAYQIWQMIPASTQAFRAAAAPWVVQALQGKLGPLAGSAKLHLILTAAATCGTEVEPLLEPYLVDDNHNLREAATTAVVNVATDSTAAALRTAWWRKQDQFTRSDLARALRRVELARPVR